MISAYILSRSFVPSRCAFWLSAAQRRSRSAPSADEENSLGVSRQSPPHYWRGLRPLGSEPSTAAIAWYTRRLDWVMSRRKSTVVAAFLLLVAVVATVGTHLRREFFPEVDAGAFEMYVRAPSGTRIEATEERIAEVEKVCSRRFRPRSHHDH